MNRFRELRKEKQLSQIALSKMLGIDQTTISRWEVGKNIPEPAMLLKLSEIYDVSIDYLLGNSTYYYPDKLPTAPALSAEEQQLLALFGKMTHVQRVKVLAYSEGLLSTNLESQSSKKQA